MSASEVGVWLLASIVGFVCACLTTQGYRRSSSARRRRRVCALAVRTSPTSHLPFPFTAPVACLSLSSVVRCVRPCFRFLSLFFSLGGALCCVVCVWLVPPFNSVRI